MKLIKSFVLLALSATSILAEAAHFKNSTGLESPRVVQTFDAALFPNWTPAGQLFDGLSFSNDVRVTSQFNGQFGSTGQALVNFYPCCTGISAIDFRTPVSGVGFLFATNLGVSRFTAVFNDTVVESFDAQTSFLPGQYYGFSNIQFNRLYIQAGGSTRAFVLDNLQIAAVPEPETYAMMLLGLGLMAALRRRALGRAK